MSADTVSLDTIDRLFCQPLVPGEKLLALIFADCWSSRLPDRSYEAQGFLKLRKKIALVRQRGYRRGQPFLLLTGTEISHLLNVKPGPKIGQLLDKLRSAQLAGIIKTKAAARAFLRPTKSAARTTKTRHGR